MKLLHIDSSILGDAGASRRLTAAIVARFRAETPALEVIHRDLVANPLPHLVQSTMPREHPFSSAPAGTPDAEELVDFLAADIVVVGAPMYNFTIPSQLKAWIDRIVVPRRTFAYGPEGVIGLAAGKRVVFAMSRGGAFGAGTPFAPFEHAESYLRAMFGFLGVTSPEVIIAEGLMMGPELSEPAMNGALQAIDQLH